jgi:purine nucleoside permease
MRKRYDGYHGMVRRLYNHNDVHCWEDFQNLKQSIEVEGFDKGFPIIVCERNGMFEIVDGQHRAAIMLFLGKENIEFIRGVEE